MIEAKKPTTVDFKQISIDDKESYDRLLSDGRTRGCEFSFANLYLWGRQQIAFIHGHAVIFSQFSRRSVYPYPVGSGDKKEVLDAIIEDSRARGIPCRITGLDLEAKETVERLYPSKFRFHCDEGAFDYVYSIDDLAELSGKKYHSKRNHVNRFREEHPNHTVKPFTDAIIPQIKQMTDEWYRERMEIDPNGDYHMEKAALERALLHYKELGMEGLVLLDGDEVLAITLGGRLSEDTFDVNFEKARAGVNGAYAAINYEFARYIREKYPDIRFLDREEDMGLEGLRRAKRSYYPHHMIEKCWGCLLEDGYDY